MGLDIDWGAIAKVIVELHGDFRQAMFSGFLTLAGFLFAVKSFALVNLIREVYNTPEYRARVKANRSGNEKTTIYGPLTGLTFTLRLGMYFCLGTAVLQIMGGKPEHWSFASLGFLSAIISLCLVIYAVRRLTANINVYIDFLESVGEGKLIQEAAEADAAAKAKNSTATTKGGSDGG